MSERPTGPPERPAPTGRSAPTEPPVPTGPAERPAPTGSPVHAGASPASSASSARPDAPADAHRSDPSAGSESRRSDAAPPPAGLRAPAHRVSPRAVPYWILSYLIGWVFVIAGAWVLALVALPDDQWWPVPAAATLTVLLIAHSVLAPVVRYRVHRWEILPTGVFTRTGWLSREERVAPLNRVQTVDSKRGALMQLFRLASVTVTTASSAGAVEIEAVDTELARQVVADLTARTSASEGDAT